MAAFGAAAGTAACVVVGAAAGAAVGAAAVGADLRHCCFFSIDGRNLKSKTGNVIPGI